MSRHGATNRIPVAMPDGSQRELEELHHNLYGPHGDRLMGTVTKGRHTIKEGKPRDAEHSDGARWVSVQKDLGGPPGAMWKDLAERRLREYSTTLDHPSYSEADHILSHPDSVPDRGYSRGHSHAGHAHGGGFMDGLASMIPGYRSPMDAVRQAEGGPSPYGDSKLQTGIAIVNPFLKTFGGVGNPVAATALATSKVLDAVSDYDKIKNAQKTGGGLAVTHADGSWDVYDNKTNTTTHHAARTPEQIAAARAARAAKEAAKKAQAAGVDPGHPSAPPTGAGYYGGGILDSIKHAAHALSAGLDDFQAQGGAVGPPSTWPVESMVNTYKKPGNTDNRSYLYQRPTSSLPTSTLSHHATYDPDMYDLVRKPAKGSVAPGGGVAGGVAGSGVAGSMGVAGSGVAGSMSGCGVAGGFGGPVRRHRRPHAPNSGRERRNALVKEIKEKHGFKSMTEASSFVKHHGLWKKD